MLHFWKKASIVFAAIAVALLVGSGVSWAESYVVNRTPDYRTIATPAANKASYWGDDCVKYESGGLFWTLKYPARLLVIKSGTVNDVWNSPVAGKYSTASRKNISHVIVCGGQPKPSESPSPSPTPSVTPSATPSVSTPAPTPTKKAVAVPTLPKTGAEDAMPIALFGLTLLGLGGACLLLYRALKNDFPKD